jgi:ABC-2 type transport system ATP-binding protein
MGAARYIGRIGGLAVALGVGTAIVTGQGVANATPPSTGGEGAQTESPSGENQDQTTAGTTNDDAPGGPDKIDVKLPRLSDVIGRHRADATTPNSATATSIVKRLSEAVEETAKRVTDALGNAAGAVNGENTTAVRTVPRSGGSSLSERLAERAERVAAGPSSPEDQLPESGIAETNNVVANKFVNRSPAVKEWLASPRIAAGRAAETAPPAPTRTSLWTPPRILTAPTAAMNAAPTTPATAKRASSLLSVVLDNVLSPFAENAPTAPTTDSPLSWIVAGAARRQIGVESFTSQSLLAPSLLAPTNSLTFDPAITLDEGVITGDIDPTTGLTYTVVSQPSGGGKVLVNPSTGDFSFLPDFSSIQNRTSEETFSVLVVENTAFTTAITQIPLVGSLASQVLVVLYQIPVVNVVLSPIIGRSKVETVTVEVGELVYNGATTPYPVAFTVMVESFDGTLISTNYFPALSVVNGPPGTTAPTILNGPGLATAGNTDPNSTTIVDGLVPGLAPLRANYNVVTWDPRGEFASGGVLQLDSPQYEGQDVKAIISWISATENRPYTHPAMETTNDPLIGMVGGSYGGGIQLVTAGIDPRVDVIVPVIAWNNLEDSLYTNEAFKTSYSSLLLLSLVTSGARINPQIYAGIITGAVLGVLTPSQRELLRSSGPWFFTAAINQPTMFIQGTVDVLFPLHQALNNAAGISTPIDDIKMIWACGGHGVCLTLTDEQLADQEERLRDNTLAWLDRALLDEDVEIPTFQFVDQNGQWYTAALLPIDNPRTDVDDFYTDSVPIVTDGTGGFLPIVPLLGGSGPQSETGFPASLGLGSVASNAINVPLDDASVGTTVVGAPQLTMTYSGIGTSRHVYAQIVDKESGLVVGNIVTPIPVTLDGRTHTQTYSMEDIVWTSDNSVPTDADLELQIVASATPYLNLTQYGFINVSDVTVSLPTPGPGADVEPETLSEPLAV